MRILILTFVMFGFASWNELWCSGLPAQHETRDGNASPVHTSTTGSRPKLDAEMLPQAAKRSSTPILSIENNSLETSTSKLTLRDYIQSLADSLHAEIGVAFRDLETGREFFFNERKMMHAASTMKVPVMIEVFRQAASGKFHLDDSLLVKNEFKSIVDGSPYNLDAGDDGDESIYGAIGGQMTIRQLVEQTITVSSNLAANILIELVGAEKVTATLRELGIRNMQVRRGVEDSKAYQLGLNNQTDAFDLMLALQAIAEKRAPLSWINCDSMFAILQRQKFRDGIPAGLPNGTIVGNKTGSITKIAHDGAIVFPKFELEKKQTITRKPYVLVVLTSGIEEEKSALRVIAAISRNIYQGLILSL